MTDNQMVDNSNEAGAGGSPSQSVSNQAGGSITDAERLQEFLKAEISKSIKPVLDEVRGVQGRQDKDRSAVRELLDEFKKQKAKGLSDTEAEHAAESVLSERSEAQRQKDLLNQIAEKVLGSSAVGNGAAQKAGIDLTQFPELDANDPEVLTHVLSLTDAKEAELAAYRLVRKRSQSNSQPSAASPATGAPAPVQDDGQKIARLNALQKEPSKNRNEIRKLEKELGW